MSTLKNLYEKMIMAMNVEKLQIPLTAVKIYKNDVEIPKEVKNTFVNDITLTSCQAYKQGYLGDAVLLTAENIGCIAAAISFGLVDQNQDRPFEGSRVYTDVMKSHAENPDEFIPPTPKEFTEGIVYACMDSGRLDFALFGKNDVGRFEKVETAKKAVAEMMAIQPATTQGVFFFNTDFDAIDIIPDVVILNVRPVELTRIIQAYQFLTGERVTANIGPVRAVNSDLIVRPYLTQEINITPYCIGARLLAVLDPNKLGIAFPWKKFEIMVEGMVKSQTGYPFEKYPGANPYSYE
ncbi:MAG TPA: DUF169 domain-containing protein [Ignavibacteriales bacterium]|nr:DUF169 domain-containing protein [Ignavibacteriales bacterium]HOL80410.1 DUF169 domain-containing protein [Ignavibacteriales bacterium]HPP32599.1 DUF169 domain-containing protein [Ignavibacteriales bacterium]HRR17434.1 DUF169 domain-containing protein [Ignavibacteriales bacterium]HRT97924.1 DUF169 domain-containing protein [Ignavibacteriales bacterium]